MRYVLVFLIQMNLLWIKAVNQLPLLEKMHVRVILVVHSFATLMALQRWLALYRGVSNATKLVFQVSTAMLSTSTIGFKIKWIDKIYKSSVYLHYSPDCSSCCPFTPSFSQIKLMTPTSSCLNCIFRVSWTPPNAYYERLIWKYTLPWKARPFRTQVFQYSFFIFRVNNRS